MKASKLVGTILVAGMLSGCSAMGDKYSVYFDSGSTKISPAGKATLVKAAQTAKAEDKKIKLSGYTDSTGSKQVNQKISEARIDSVNKELKKMGVNSMMISGKSVHGEGWFDKKDKNDSTKRRVTVSVY